MVLDRRGFIDENTPLNPISLYGKDKVEAEKVLLIQMQFRLAKYLVPLVKWIYSSMILSTVLSEIVYCFV